MNRKSLPADLPTRAASMLASALLLTAATATVSLAHDRAQSPHASYQAQGSEHERDRGDRGHRGEPGHGGKHHGDEGRDSRPRDDAPAAANPAAQSPGHDGTPAGAPAAADHGGSAARVASAAPGSASDAPAMSRSIVTGNPQSVPRATLSALGASEAPGASAQGSAGAAPTGEVLAASTTAPAPVLGINSPTQLALATIPGVVAHAYGAAAGGFGSQPEVLKIALVLAWLAINGAGFLVYRKRLASVGAGEVFPLTLGAVTYRSGAGTRA